MAAIVTTTVVDFRVPIIPTIGQSTPPLVLVTIIFIIPENASISEPMWTATFLCNAICSPWPLITSITSKCFHTVKETDITANIDSHLPLNSTTFAIFSTIVLSVLISVSTGPMSRTTTSWHWKCICSIWPLLCYPYPNSWIYKLYTIVSHLVVKDITKLLNSTVHVYIILIMKHIPLLIFARTYLG